MKTTLWIALLILILSETSFAKTNAAKVHVNGMVCGFCTQGLTRRFQKEPSVKRVSVSLDTKAVYLVFNEGQHLSNRRLADIVADAGFDATKIQRVIARQK